MKEEDKKKYANIYNNLALLYVKIGKRSKAYNSLRKAITLRESLLDDSVKIADYYLTIAKLYEEDKKYDKAIYYHLKRIKLLEKMKIKDGLTLSYENVGLLYSESKNDPLAIKYYLKAKKLLKEELSYENALRIINIENKIINMDTYNNNDDRIIDYYLETIKLLEDLNDDRASGMLAHFYMLVGNYYNYKEEYELAKEYYLKNISLREIAGDREFLILSYIHLLSLSDKLKENYENIKNKLDAIINSV